MGGFAGVFGNFINGYMQKSHQMIQDKMERSKGLMEMATHYANIADSTSDPSVRAKAGEGIQNMLDETTKVLNESHAKGWKDISQQIKKAPGGIMSILGKMGGGSGQGTSNVEPGGNPAQEMYPGQGTSPDQGQAPQSPITAPAQTVQSEAPTDFMGSQGTPYTPPKPETAAPLASPPAQTATPAPAAPAARTTPMAGMTNIPRLEDFPPGTMNARGYREMTQQLALKNINAQQANQTLQPMSNFFDYVNKKRQDAQAQGKPYNAWEALNDPEIASRRMEVEKANMQYESLTGKKLPFQDQLKAAFPDWDAALKLKEGASEADRMRQLPSFSQFQSDHPEEANRMLLAVESGKTVPPLAGTKESGAYLDPKTNKWAKDMVNANTGEHIASIPAEEPAHIFKQRQDIEAWKASHPGQFSNDADAMAGYFKQVGTKNALEIAEKNMDISSKQSMIDLRNERAANIKVLQTSKDQKERSRAARSAVDTARQEATMMVPTGGPAWTMAFHQNLLGTGKTFTQLQKEIGEIPASNPNDEANDYLNKAPKGKTKLAPRLTPPDVQ